MIIETTNCNYNIVLTIEKQENQNYKIIVSNVKTGLILIITPFENLEQATQEYKNLIKKYTQKKVISELTINLHKYYNSRVSVLVGRFAGESLLKEIEKDYGLLEKLENKYDIIKILIPSSILTMNKEFFIGCWCLRVMSLGIKTFNTKYIFQTNDTINTRITKKYVVSIESNHYEQTTKSR